MTRDTTVDLAVTPPVALCRPEAIEAHGRVRIDEWKWLADRDNPEVIAHLEAENRYAATATADQAGLARVIYGEIATRVVEDNVDVPVREGRYEYFTRTRAGLPYPILYRRPARRGPIGSDIPHVVEAASDEQVILDENVEARGHDYFALGGMHVSVDGSRMAWLRDTTGDERFELVVRDLDSGEDTVVARDVGYGVEWAVGDTVLYYVRHDDALRPHQVWRHRFLPGAAGDELVVVEDDERFFVSLDKTRTGRFIAVTSAATSTSEVTLLDGRVPDAVGFVVRARHDGLEYDVCHWTGDGRDWLFVTHNAGGAQNFQLSVAEIRHESGGTAVGEWHTVWAEQVDRRLEGVDALAGHLVVSTRGEAATFVGIADLAATAAGPAVGPVRTVPVPQAPAACWADVGPEFDADEILVGWTSLAAPVTVCRLELDSLALTEVWRQPVARFDAGRYVTERVWATALDGTEVPISLVYRRTDGDTPGPRPVVLYGYGAYEHSVDPAFSISRLSLLDRGVIFAVAHVRGGGELGRPWYDQGRMGAKMNTFTDFVACAKHLVASGWCDGRIAVRGRSAGGLLIGASVNLAPELFTVAVAEVPFVDALTTMMDPTIPLTTGEFDEWGNPGMDESAYESMGRWSPYDNVSSARYPAMLVTAGLSDPRVGYWEPAKWVQRLRSRTVGDGPIVLRCEMGAGHFGRSGRYAAWEEEAGTLAFILTGLGCVGRVDDPGVAGG